jgi:molecular chaperone HscB
MSVTKTRTDANPGVACWSCAAPVNAGHFCAACGKIQRLPAGADFFGALGLPRKLQVNLEDLEQRFHHLSWKLHPDNFVRASEFERNLSLERSSELNDAYRTLQNPISRVEYLLAQAGVRKEGASKQQAPPELLEEVFELNESLDELREARESGGDLGQLRERLNAAQRNFQEKLNEVDAELQAIFAEWDKSVDSNSGMPTQQDLMARMNEVLNRRSYIRNLVANVQKELVEE